MSEKPEFKGCGAPAEAIVFRGRTKRLFVCGECEHTSTGRQMPYETDVLGQVKKDGTFYGPAKRCGDETL